MLTIDLAELRQFTAGDGTILKEFLHPDKMDIKLRYSLAHAVLKPGGVSAPHRLKTSEVYYILEGEGSMHVDKETRMVRPGHVVYIPPLSIQHIANTGKGDLKFLCIVDPAWRPEDEEIL